MDPDYWQQRWHDNRIGFHQADVTPRLITHWPSVCAPAGSRVFVPLAGKSLDMVWLAAQGHHVLGIELSPLAVEQFFAEHDLQPEIAESRYGRHHVAGGIELICGDVFDLDASALAGCSAFFDRAALIALPPELRARYADAVYSCLPSDCRGLLVTLEYPPHEMAGPPFSVTGAEVEERFGRHWRIDPLERSDILAGEQSFIDDGVTSLETCVYRLTKIV